MLQKELDHSNAAILASEVKQVRLRIVIDLKALANEDLDEKMRSSDRAVQCLGRSACEKLVSTLAKRSYLALNRTQAFKDLDNAILISGVVVFDHFAKLFEVGLKEGCRHVNDSLLATQMMV